MGYNKKIDMKYYLLYIYNMETFYIMELKDAYDEILKNTWNNGKAKSDVDDAKKMFMRDIMYMVFI